MARPRIHDDAVRQRLLEVASTIIAEHGEAALSVRGAAADAGTTTAAVYSLFGSRQALIEQVVVEGFARFAAHLAAVEHTDDPAADLTALGIAYRANALQNPHFYRVMFGLSFGAGPRNQGGETFAVLVAAVARAADCDQAEARIRAQRVWAYVHGLVSLELIGLVEAPAASEAAASGAAGGDPADDDGAAEFAQALRAASSLIRSG